MAELVHRPSSPKALGRHGDREDGSLSGDSESLGLAQECPAACSNLLKSGSVVLSEKC